MPFALGLAYTSALWVVLTNIDKLILSSILPLKEYGYFSLIAVVVGGMGALSSPIGTAIRPRMTSLISQGKEREMIALYKKGTQFVAVAGFAASGTVAFFSTELLYAWTGNIEAANWAGPILFWYALGNGMLMVLAFQFYLQFAYGNLKYHIRGNTIFGLIQILVMIMAVYAYGALGAAIAWFLLQAIFLLFWPAYIHSKFASGIHKEWFFKDVLPMMLSSLILLSLIKSYNINLLYFERSELFIILLIIGFVVLIVNAFISSEARKIILHRLKSV